MSDLNSAASDLRRIDWKTNWDRPVALVALVYFTATLVWLAVSLHPSIPPDEETHLARCQLFTQTFGIPAKSDATNAVGLLLHEPYLYYYAMGRFLNLNVTSVSPLIYLRLINVVLGVLTVVLGYLWFCRTTRDPIARSLFIVILTNTLMFIVLCASVNYDNLVNLLAVAALYFLSRYTASQRWIDLAAFAVAVMCGTLTKVTFLPLAALLLVAFVVWQRGIPRDVLRQLATLPGIASGAAIALLLLLNVQLYGTNLLRFGRPVPKPAQVLELEEMLAYRVYARNHIAREHREGNITLEEAFAASQEIEHQSDREDLRAMLVVQERRRANPRPRMNPPRHLQIWSYFIARRIYGVAAHEFIVRTDLALLIYGAIGAIAAAIFLRIAIDPSTRETDLSGGAAVLYVAALLALGYAAVLWYVNYGTYRSTGFVANAVQGRYLFPVIVPIYAVIARYWTCYWPLDLRPWGPRVAAGIIAAWFIWGGLPLFIQQTTPLWFR